MMLYSILIKLLSISFVIASVTTERKECIPKLTPNMESPVCVCNSSYCDTLPTVEKPKNSRYLTYVTSKSGLRLKENTQEFDKDGADSSVSIKIYPNKEYQPITEWGGAITDSAAINIIKGLTKGAQEQLMKSYFSNEGLEYNIVRVPIAGTDFSVRYYTYDDGKEDPRLENFSLAKEDIDYKIPLIKSAKTYSNATLLHLIAAAWEAPRWMKNSNTMKPSMYQAWANYHLKFLQSYKERGIDFWAISTGNEPFVAAASHLPQFIGWDPHNMCTWISLHLGPTIQKSELPNVKIVTFDDWRGKLPRYLDEVLCNNNSLKYVHGIALHWYDDGNYPPTRLDITHYKYPDKFILYTEACVTILDYGIQHGSWLFADFYAEDIIQNLNHWSIGWMDWNIALNMEGGPNILNITTNSPVFIDSSKGEFYKQPMYYILGHFSKFILRDSVRIKYKCSDKDLPVVAAKRPDGGIVVVILNRNDTEINVTISIKKHQHINLKLIPKSIITVLY